MRRVCLGLTVLLFAASAPLLQDTRASESAPGTQLAPGNPPLTLEMSGQIADFFEWLFDLRLSPAQRALITSKLLQSWTAGDQPAIDSVVASTRLYQQLRAEPQEKRRQLREETWRGLLESFRQQNPGTLARLIVQFYDEAHPAGTSAGGMPPRADGGAASGSSRIPSELVGEWIARRGSGTSYVNPSTGATSAPDATIDSYKFFANGTYEHGMLMQTSLYDCTTTIFGREVGPVMVQGTTLTITPGAGTLDYKSSCSPSMNSNKPTEFPPETMDWRIDRDQYGTMVCFQKHSDGKSGCYYKQ